MAPFLSGNFFFYKMATEMPFVSYMCYIMIYNFIVTAVCLLLFQLSVTIGYQLNNPVDCLGTSLVCEYKVTRFPSWRQP